jgi:hypothetical protein
MPPINCFPARSDDVARESLAADFNGVNDAGDGDRALNAPWRRISLISKKRGPAHAALPFRSPHHGRNNQRSAKT